MTDGPTTFKSAKLQKFYDYWQSKVRDGRLPARADIDPVDIHDLLPSIVIIDVVTEGHRRRFRFRLFGTEHVEFNQRDLTGMFIDEVFGPKDAAKTADAYAHIIDEGEPHFWRTNVMLPGREFVHYERLMLPLASDGKTVDMLIGVFEFDRIEPARGA